MWTYSRRLERAEAIPHTQRSLRSAWQRLARQGRQASTLRGAFAELLEGRTLLAAPPNDMFANAELIDSTDLVSGYTDRWAVTGSNVGATLETGEPNHYGTNANASIWYRWQAPQLGRIQVDTNGSNFDTIVAVYTGSALTNLQMRATDDDSGTDGQDSQVVISATTGSTYWIAVAGYRFDYGQVKLNLHHLPNQAPAGMAFAPVNQVATYKFGASVGLFSASDPDAGDTFTYSLVSGDGDADNARFTTVNNELRTAASVAPGTYSIRARVTDAGGLFVERVFTVHLIGTPLNLTPAGQWGGLTSAVALDGNRAYTTRGNLLVVLDLSQPANPQEMAQVVLPEAPQGISVAGGLACVADGYSGLLVFDVSNPADPRLLGSSDTNGCALGVSMAGDLAYIADGSNGLQVFDLSNPASPLRLGGYGTNMSTYAAVTVGNRAYLADGYNGLQVLDISNPANPTRLGGYDTSGIARGVSVVGNLAYVADDSAGLQIIDVSDPARPVRLGGYFISGAVATGVSAVGNVVYLAAGSAGVQVIDAQNPAIPVRLYYYDTFGTAPAVAVAGNILCLADGYGGLLVLDARDPTYLTLLGEDTVGFAVAVQMIGTVAYVADMSHGLQIVDMSNLAAPVRVGQCGTSNASGVAVVGTIAYIADDYWGLRIIDVSNPAAPVRLGEYKTGGNARGVYVVGTTAYVATGSQGLQIIDVSNPANPIRLGGYDTMGDAYAVTVVGTRAYIADWDHGLQIIDVSNPASPVRLGGYDTTGYAYDVTVIADTAYIADGTSGLQILDVSSPSTPVRLGGYDTPGQASNLQVVGSIVYIADRTGGLQIIDVTDRSFPVRLGDYPLPVIAFDVSVVGEVAYMADYSAGMVALRFGMPPIAPTDLALSTTVVAENLPVGAPVGTFTATDPNAGQTFAYALVAGEGDADNASFTIVGDQLVTAASFDFETRNSYSVRVRVSDSDGLGYEEVFTISITDVDEVAPTVASVSINDGALQRSMVRKLSITFSEPVVLAVGALAVKLQSGAMPPNTTVNIANPSADQETYLLTFSGTGAIAGSLADGIYDLIVTASGVQDPAGNALTANYTKRFHRLFGDVDGNKVVNALDYAKLKATYGRSSADPLFNPAFDYEGNGVINALDLAQFRKRYGLLFSY